MTAGLIKAIGLSLGALIISVASASAAPFTLLNHSATVEATGDLFNVTGVAADSDTPTSPVDPQTTALASQTHVQGVHPFNRTFGFANTLWTSASGLLYGDAGAFYHSGTSGGGTDVGGTSSGTANGSMLFSLDAPSVEIEYTVETGVLFDLGGGGTGTESYVLELTNLSTGQTLLSLTNTAVLTPTFLTFTGTVGDIIRWDFFGTSTMTVAAGLDEHTMRGVRAVLNVSEFTAESGVPTPGPLGLIGIGLLGLGLRRVQKSRVQ